MTLYIVYYISNNFDTKHVKGVFLTPGEAGVYTNKRSGYYTIPLRFDFQ